MSDLTGSYVIIHFRDGSIQSGTLRSPLPADETLLFIRHPFAEGRRKTPRIPFITEVRIDQNVLRRALDLSIHGMYVETLTIYEVGARVPVFFQLDDEMVDIEARVAFTDPGIGMGLEFQSLSPEVRLKLESFIQESMGSRTNPLPQDRRSLGRQAIDSEKPMAVKGRPVSLRPVPDRRRGGEGAAPAPLELKCDQIKSIFFVDRIKEPDPRQQTSQPQSHEIVVGFTDGEVIHGYLHRQPPDTKGFFINLPDAQGSYYQVYVFKDAVREIRHL